MNIGVHLIGIMKLTMLVKTVHGMHNFKVNIQIHTPRE